jgi:hypothetical protein
MSNPLTALSEQLQRLGYGGPTGPSTLASNKGRVFMPQIDTSMLKSWLYKIGVVLAILVAVFLILLIIHYTIRPIFKFTPESTGIIPIPFVSDGSTLFWEDNTSTITENAVKGGINNIIYNYSMVLDILIVDPMIEPDIPYKQLLKRSSTDADGSPQLKIVLENQTNDIIIELRTDDLNNNTITLTLPNVPIGKPFTIGVVVGSHYMEAYMNGKLHKTVAFNTTPNSHIGAIFPPSSTLAGAIVVKNLRTWPTAITPSIIQSIAVPSIGSFGTITGRAIVSTSCRNAA